MCSSDLVGTVTGRFNSDQRFADALHVAGVLVPRVLRRLEVGELEVVAVERLDTLRAPSFHDWNLVGEMVRTIHSLPTDAFDLPSCLSFDHWQLEDRFAELASALPLAAAAGIETALRRWSSWRRDAVEHMVVCHGDVHPGNVVVTSRGPALIDLDLRCKAPAAWDHAALLTWEHRWNASAGTYTAFAAGYGHSMVDDIVGREFAELRLVASTLMCVIAAQSNPLRSAEADIRLRYWAGDTHSPRWTPQ